MRAITGAIVSSKPCSLAKAACILERFSDSAASHLPSSDCAAYLRTAAEAASQHNLFRRDLRARLQQAAAASFDAHVHERPVEGDMKRQDRERKGGTAAPAGGSNRDSAAKAELEVASGEGKGKKKVKKEDLHEDRAVADSHIPSPPVILVERRKKEKHPDQETVVHVKLEPGSAVEEELGSEKKQKRKKKKDHVKLEEEEDANAVGGKIVTVNDGAGEQLVAGGEKKRKRKNHEKAVKDEKAMVADGDLDTDEKKRRKKRGRGDRDDNAIEQVEHTKKKQRKQS